jgi:RNA polymerase sigma factor for flagellar operon FliA
MAANPPPIPSAALRPDPADIGPVWASFVHTRDGGARERLVSAYMGFARMMAAKVYARRTIDGMEFADYLQYARLGLLEAVDRFDPERGVLFESFAAIRMTGAILTGLESSSEIQRQIATRKRVIGDRVSSLAEPAPPLTGAEAVFARLAEMAIGLAVGFALEDSGMYLQEEAEYADNSYTGVELRQLRGRVKAALGGLGPNQRRVIELHYLQHLPFEDVASRMSLTRGRISQIHKEALQNLRVLLTKTDAIDLHC